MTCADARALASLSLDGELDELGSRQLRGHVASCRDCARAIGKMRLASELLRSAPRARFRCDLTARAARPHVLLRDREEGSGQGPQ